MQIKINYSCSQIIVALLFAYIGMVYFSMAIPNIILGLGVAVFLYGIFLKRIKLIFIKRNWLLFGLIITPFLLTVVSMLYSDNYIKGLNYVWLRVPIIVISFIIGFMQTKSKEIKQGLIVFCGLTIVGSLKTIYNAIRYLNEDVLLIPDFTFLITAIQHPYFGILVLIAFVSIIEFQLIKFRPVRISVYVLFTFVIVLTTSRLVYLLYILLIGMYILKYFSIKRGVLSIVLLIVLSSILVVSNTAIKNKFQTSYIYQNSPRLKLWNNSFKILESSNNRLFGIGIGDYYSENKDVYFFREGKSGTLGYNPHSQIIEFIVTNGVFGFLILAVTLIIASSAIVRQNRFAKIVFGIIVAFSLTESILTRQYGVQLYSVFIPLIFSINLKKEE